MANGRKSSQVVINIAQHFEKTKWRAVAEAVINLSVSLILTYKFGIYGVLLGTIAALLYRTNDVIIYAARLMERSPFITYKRWGINILIFIGIISIANKIEFVCTNYLSLIIYGIILCVTVIPTFLIIDSIFELKTSRIMLNMFKKMFKR